MMDRFKMKQKPSRNASIDSVATAGEWKERSDEDRDKAEKWIKFVASPENRQ